jgi:hypothetical protein
MNSINKTDEMISLANKNNRNKLIKNAIKPQALKTLDESCSITETLDHNCNENEFETEAESLINIHIASNLNENTFHLSPNQVNFYSEQIENQFMVNYGFTKKVLMLK